MKKIAVMLLCFCLLCICPAVAFAQTVTATDVGTDVMIGVTVPEHHQIVVIAEHSKVSTNGQTGNNLTVERLSQPRLLIRPDNGYKVIKVTLNGEDITSSVIGGYYFLTPIYEDKTLTVETVKVFQNDDSIHEISGTITDENGEPVSGATVDIDGKSDVTDKNGHFTIEGVPDGHHSVTVTDSDGNIIGYTEIEVGVGKTGLAQNQDGCYTLTVPQNSGLALTLTVTEEGRLLVEKMVDITLEPEEHDDIPQTGDNGNILWWILLTFASALMFIGTIINFRLKET